MKLNVLAASVAAATSLMFAGAAQAAVFVIDDWNINAASGNFVTATGTGSSDGPTGRTATGGNSLTRAKIFTTVTGVGSAAQNRLGDCDTCKFGTFSNDVGTTGWGYWSWTANDLDLSSFDKVAFEYFADLISADVVVAFFDGNTRVASAQESDLGNPGGPSLAIPFELLIDLSGATLVDEVRLYVFSAGGNVNTGNTGIAEVDAKNVGVVNAGAAQPDGLDFGIRAFKASNDVPEPSSLALLGLSLAALGFMRRRRA